MKPEPIPEGHKWCPGCASAVMLSSFSPDRARPPLFVRGKCKPCETRDRAHKVAKSRKVSRGLVKTPEQHAHRMVSEAAAFAEANGIEFAITVDHLSPLPPVCPLTLDNLLVGRDGQVPTLALLVDSEGFTVDNTVIVSSRARRGHQVIGARALRRNVGTPEALGRAAIAVLCEVLERFNRLFWEAEVIDITAEVAALESNKRGHLIVPPAGRVVKWEPLDVKAESVANWCDLIDSDAPRWYRAAGWRLPPERDHVPVLSRVLREERTPEEWFQWATEQPPSAGHGRPKVSPEGTLCHCDFCIRFPAKPVLTSLLFN